jgi:hypothetical protein
MTPLRHGATLLACHSVPDRAILSLRRVGGDAKSCQHVPVNDATSPSRSNGSAASKSGWHRHTLISPFFVQFDMVTIYYRLNPRSPSHQRENDSAEDYDDPPFIQNNIRIACGL